MFIAFCIIIQILIYKCAICQEVWVDPHSMGGQVDIKSFNVQECPMSINFSISHYKRLINLLLNLVQVDLSDMTYKGHFDIDISEENYKSLLEFAKSIENKEDATVLRQIDQILSKILAKTTTKHLTELLVSWTDAIYFSFYNRTTGILMTCMCMLFISYKLLRAKWTIFNVLKYLILLGWIVDFAFRWIHLLQEAEINKLADSVKYDSMPHQCNPNKMDNWQYFRYLFSTKDECRDYYHTVYKESFWSVAPITVLSHQFGVVILTPATYVGQALGQLSSGILNSLPWGVNVVLLPVLLMFLAIMLCITFAYVSGTSFSICILHLLQFKFGNERRVEQDVLTGHNVTTLLNLTHRSMIEDIKRDKSPEKLCSSSLEDTQKGDDSKVQESVKDVDQTISEVEVSKIEDLSVGETSNDQPSK